MASSILAIKGPVVRVGSSGRVVPFSSRTPEYEVGVPPRASELSDLLGAAFNSHSPLPVSSKDYDDLWTQVQTLDPESNQGTRAIYFKALQTLAEDGSREHRVNALTELVSVAEKKGDVPEGKTQEQALKNDAEQVLNNLEVKASAIKLARELAAETGYSEGMALRMFTTILSECKKEGKTDAAKRGILSSKINDLIIIAKKFIGAPEGQALSWLLNNAQSKLGITLSFDYIRDLGSASSDSTGSVIMCASAASVIMCASAALNSEDPVILQNAIYLLSGDFADNGHYIVHEAVATVSDSDERVKSAIDKLVNLGAYDVLDRIARSVAARNPSPERAREDADDCEYSPNDVPTAFKLAVKGMGELHYLGGLEKLMADLKLSDEPEFAKVVSDQLTEISNIRQKELANLIDLIANNGVLPLKEGEPRPAEEPSEL